MSTEINFNVSKEEHQIISRIAARAVQHAAEARIKYDHMTACMDITAVHANGCPLDLEKLLDAPDFDFSHDVFGIRRHLDRETGQLGDCFLPRCARREAA